MKGKKMFIQNLIDATKAGNIKWEIDGRSSWCDCDTKIDTTSVSVKVNFNVDKSWDFNDRFANVFLYDKQNIEGDSISIMNKEYSSVKELHRLLYDKYVLPFIQKSNKDQKNDSHLTNLANKIGKFYFRERRLGKILDKDK